MSTQGAHHTLTCLRSGMFATRGTNGYCFFFLGGAFSADAAFTVRDRETGELVRLSVTTELSRDRDACTADDDDANEAFNVAVRLTD